LKSYDKGEPEMVKAKETPEKEFITDNEKKGGSPKKKKENPGIFKLGTKEIRLCEYSCFCFSYKLGIRKFCVRMIHNVYFILKMM